MALTTVLRTNVLHCDKHMRVIMLNSFFPYVESREIKLWNVPIVYTAL